MHVEHLHVRTMSMVSGVENLKKKDTLRVTDSSLQLVFDHSDPNFQASSLPQ